MVSKYAFAGFAKSDRNFDTNWISLLPDVLSALWPRYTLRVDGRCDGTCIGGGGRYAGGSSAGFRRSSRFLQCRFENLGHIAASHSLVGSTSQIAVRRALGFVHRSIGSYIYIA